MLAAFMNGAGTIEELLVVSVVAMLSATVYDVNRAIWPTSVGLSAS
jgi:hypothetical protein